MASMGKHVNGCDCERGKLKQCHQHSEADEWLWGSQEERQNSSAPNKHGSLLPNTSWNRIGALNKAGRLKWCSLCVGRLSVYLCLIFIKTCYTCHNKVTYHRHTASAAFFPKFKTWDTFSRYIFSDCTPKSSLVFLPRTCLHVFWFKFT